MVLSTSIDLGQVRTSTHIYRCKVTPDQHLIFKIYDTKRRCLYRKSYTLEQLGMRDVNALPSTKEFLDTFLKTNPVPQEYQLPITTTPTRQECENLLENVICHATSKILVEPKEMHGITCPITLEIFKDPVQLNCGHTFEKTAIDQSLKTKRTCPECKTCITSSSPNIAVKRLIDTAQQQDPIPTFKLFRKDNPRLVTQALTSMEAQLEEGEYQEALKSFETALQFKENSNDYKHLSGIYKKLGDQERATLAHLTLALYQLREEETVNALQTLLNIPQDIDIHYQSISQIHLLIVKLYQYHNQDGEALSYAKKILPHLQGHPTDAKDLCSHIIAHHPHEYEVYQTLADLIEDPQEKTYVLLQCACKALEENNMPLVEELNRKACEIYPGPFLDRRIYLKAFVLEHLASCYKDLPKELVKVQKELLSQYIRCQEWLKAEEIALEILPKTSKKMPLCEQLENIYKHHTSPKLPQGLTTIADTYQKIGETLQAERVYQQLFDLDPTYERGVDLAGSLAKQNKTAQAVRLYYKTTALALLEENTAGLAHCIESMKAIDPKLQHLSFSEKTQLLTQSQCLTLQSQCLELSKRIDVLENRLAVSSEQLQQTQKTITLQIPKMAFGALKWQQYFGDVGLEPPLPADIETILTSPCPFWPDKKVQETHMLVLIPKTVNGAPFTLNTLEELIKKPKQGHPTQYSYYWDTAKTQLGDQSLSQSIWILMAKDVLPDTRSKSYADQCQIVERYSQKTHLPYQIPNTLIAATAILVEHVQTGTRLYSHQPLTYTRCQEKVGGYQMAVGGFSSSGLNVSRNGDVNGYVGVSALRKF